MAPSFLKKIYLLASSLGIYFISRYVIKTFEELTVASFLFILLFNVPTFIRLFLWISGIDRKISIKVLTVNYLSGFLLYLLCIVGLFITGEKYNVLAGAIPFASYFTIGSIFVLHGINFLLLFPKTKGVLPALILSYTLTFIVQFMCLFLQGPVNMFLTSMFFAVWTIVLSMTGIRNWKSIALGESS